jgi:hypothetical protein
MLPDVGSPTNPKRKRGPQTISSLTLRVSILSALQCLGLGRYGVRPVIGPLAPVAVPFPQTWR